ncbi:MAG: hypothetical protein FYV88_0480 [Bacteroidetes bacterium]|nr:hypothetical protein [Bacteroidota bacterium]
MNRSMKHISLFAVLLLYVGFAQGQMQMPTAGNPIRLRDSVLYLPIRLVASDTYSKELAFFCKREWELEKKTGVPMKFRLGSVDYVNTLEGKNQPMRLPLPFVPLPSGVRNVPHKL